MIYLWNLMISRFFATSKYHELAAASGWTSLICRWNILKYQFAVPPNCLSTSQFPTDPTSVVLQRPGLIFIHPRKILKVQTVATSCCMFVVSQMTFRVSKTTWSKWHVLSNIPMAFPMAFLGNPSHREAQAHGAGTPGDRTSRGSLHR